MTLKEFGEDAEIVVTVTISVNDEVAFRANTYDIDEAIEQLGKAERANVIRSRLEEQFESLPELIEDEARGYND